ncbi:hypothetical protein HETIRDRAFT_456205 [Heterobasidion irregulare TC 32-1]|uniref:Methyltransferase domain-containing protein n=1 Tax=Heterobasidion irregulare (strain TC 32-1) TaxID=747525 RepID=W4JNI8_HETIT|nr:uncharacterized protein HETIRDRAFT_456205 [Heterobasidion irregulare TC 32-1]ETW74630.1 hypothetical protein HETIRDRAFT_456205 [Heterobasidion irregulare TC 32-1]
MSAAAARPPTLPAPFSPDTVAGLCLHEPKHFKVQLQSTAHRAAIIAHWVIPAGARGDTTAVLAELVGETGHVTGVDPGALDYGSPFTLGQAQAHLSAGPLGPRITWAHADPLAFLAARAPDAPPFDVAVLSLCTWYFASPRVLSALLAALAPHATRLCVAEWSLSAARPVWCAEFVHA